MKNKERPTLPTFEELRKLGRSELNAVLADLIVVLSLNEDFDPQTATLEELGSRSDVSAALLQAAAASHDWQIRKAAAGKPQLSPEDFDRLAHDHDPDVRQEVASNVRAPESVLLKLANDTTGKIMLQAANTLFLQGNAVGQETLTKLVEHTLAANRVLAASLTGLSGEHQVKLAKDRTSRVIKTLCENPSLVKEAQEILLKRAKVNDLVYLLLRNESMHESVLEQAVAHADARVVAAACRHPRTSISTLERVLTHEDWNVRLAIAGNPAATPKILARLAKDKDSDVLEGVAENLNTEPAVLARLAKKHKYEAPIHSTIAENPNTPAETLEWLAKSSDWCAREAVASNDNTPVEVLIRLSQDEDSSVAERAKSNPNYPADIAGWAMGLEQWV